MKEFDIKHHRKMKAEYTKACESDEHRPKSKTKLGMWFSSLMELDIPAEFIEWICEIEGEYDFIKIFNNNNNKTFIEKFCQKNKHRPSVKGNTKEEVDAAKWFHGLTSHPSTKSKYYQNLYNWALDIIDTYPTAEDKYRDDMITSFKKFVKDNGYKPSQASSNPFERDLQAFADGLYFNFENREYPNKDAIEKDFITLYRNTPIKKFYDSYYNTTRPKYETEASKRRYAKKLNISVEAVKQLSCNELWLELQTLKDSIKPLKRKSPTV